MGSTARWRERRSPRDGVGEWTGDRAFWGVSALLFVLCATATVVSSRSMSSMGGMAMPGDWTMSMAWMRMPGQAWSAVGASFLDMWMMMMVPMMLPSLIPMLRRYRQTIGGTSAARREWLTIVVGAGYFLVWAILGLAAFVIGAALASIETGRPALARAAPVAAGMVVLGAGLLQLTAWKTSRLACCRESHGYGYGRTLPPNAAAAWRYGIRIGVDCSYCCAGLTTVLLVIGVMDLCAMVAVTAAISAERLLPAGERIARAIGYLVLGKGLLLIAQATGLV